MPKDSTKPEGQVIAELDSLRKSTMVNFLREQLGKPYQYGVDSSATGNTIFDCSSLVQEAYRRIGVEIARTSVNQATYFGRPVELREEYQIGDLLFFTGEYGYYNPQYPMGIGHVVTYIGDGKVIHTRSWQDEDGIENGQVIEETVEEALLRRAEQVDKTDDLVVVKRVFEGNIFYHEGQTKPLPPLPVDRVE